MPSTIDNIEIEKFEKMAQEWWNPHGKFKPLHKFNPNRLLFIRKKICNFFELDEKALKPFANLEILDIGCGGGLIAEPICNMGAKITAIDASAVNIEIAKIHCAKTNLKINYLQSTAEELANKNNKFDVILALEVIEHVADIDLFIKSCSQLLKPNGLLFISTINRTLKSLAFAKIGAEYVLRWLPIGTHDYKKFVKPSQIYANSNKYNLQLLELSGFSYNMFKDSWSETNDVNINYFAILKN